MKRLGTWGAKTWSQAFAVVAVAGAAALGGCGGGGNGNSGGDGSDGGGADATPGATSDAGDGGNLIGNTPSVTAITISPLQAAITSVNGAAAKQPFTVHVQYSNGTTGTLSSGVSWMADSPLVGAIDNTGNYTASGALGAVVNVSAAYKTFTAKATLTVKLLLQTNSMNVPPAAQTGLQGASTPDANVVWAYPYDGTVWPRGLIAPILQWNGGAATDDYYVHIVSPTFELQQFSNATGAPASQIRHRRGDVDEVHRLHLGRDAGHRQPVGRHGGHEDRVADLDHRAGLDARHHLLLVQQPGARAAHPARRRGARRLREPGSAQRPDPVPREQLPDDVPHRQRRRLDHHQRRRRVRRQLQPEDRPAHRLAGRDLGPDGRGRQQLVGREMDDARPVARRKVPGHELDGRGPRVRERRHHSGIPRHVHDGGRHAGAHQWPDERAPRAAHLVARGQSHRVRQRGRSHDGPWYSAWHDPPPGDLQVYQFDASANPMVTGPTTLVATGADPNHRISWPTITPDGKWVLYSRAAGADTRTLSTASTGAAGPSDLYFASALTPNQEVRLAKLDGDGYPFAAGQRDQSWNFEPSFAPVAAGGYFWVVFTSRRTYGNILTGPAEAAGAALGTKQLWVAAIEQNPKPGVDPSHAAFHLTGQDETNLAMRGFWSLPPCAQNGQGCETGTDCCGGYCAAGDDGGAPVCRSMPVGCSQNGDKCTTTADCCNSGQGVTCIASVCSEPTPQ